MSYLTLAIATGRTLKSTFKLFEKAGLNFPDYHSKSRKLVFYNDKKTIKLICVKAVDVCTYVEQGAADVGVVGKDNILEADANVYELLDLKIGKCKFSVASLQDHPSLDEVDELKVASKYPRVAKRFFDELNIDIETIKLNGSVELAPLIGMADCVVDIVETGTTLKENGLKVLADISNISTRLIVNKSSFATKTTRIQQLIEEIKKGLE